MPKRTNTEDKESRLIGYTFLGEPMVVATSPEGRLVAISGDGSNYAPFKTRLGIYVRGSTPDPNSREDFSKVPKAGEHLVTSYRFGFGRNVTFARIDQINKNLSLPTT